MAAWTYSIDSDGDLEMNGEDCDHYIPKEDFPQILALITPKVTEASPAAGDRVVFTIEDGHLIWRKGGDYGIIYMADDDDTGNVLSYAPKPKTYRTMAAWLVDHQPAVDLDTVKAWDTYRDASGPVHAFIQSRIAAANRVEFYFARDHLNWRCGDVAGEIFVARGADRLAGIEISDKYADMAAWLIKNQPAVTIDQVKAWGQWSSAQEPVYAFIQAQAKPQPAAKDGPWYRKDGLLYHRSYSKMHVIGSALACPDDQDAAEWALAAQPEVSAEDLAYLTTAHNTSPACAARLREIRARLESAAEQANPADKLHIDNNGNLMYGDCCIALRRANIDGIFRRIIAADLALSAAEVDDLAAMPSIRAVEWLRRRLDQNASSATPAPWYVTGGELKYRGRPTHVADVRYDDDHVIDWVIENQPQVSDADIKYLTGGGGASSQDCLARLREIRAAMEAPKDCDPPCDDCDCASISADVAPAPETPVQRNVVITITFHPADTATARKVYAAVDDLSYTLPREAIAICVR